MKWVFGENNDRCWRGRILLGDSGGEEEWDF